MLYLPESIQQLSEAKQKAFVAAYEYLEQSDIPKAKAIALSMLAAERAGERSGKKATDEGQMFAVNFADNGTLLAVQEQLRDTLPLETEWTEPGDFHLTLVYLPEGGGDSLYPDNIYLFTAFDTPASQVSIFDTPDAYAVVVLLAKNNDLLLLQRVIFNACQDLGLAVGSYSLPSQYNPHITLGYIPKREGERLPYFEASYPLIFSINEVSFYNAFNEVARTFPLPVPLPEPEEPKVEGYASAGKSLVQRLVDWWHGVKEVSAPEEALAFDSPQGFKMLTNNRWIAWYTNAYQDKDGEFFPTKAIEEDVSRMWETKNFPELWFWHIPGSKHGHADWVGLVGRFAVATGTFDNTPRAEAFKTYYASSPIKLSHGFFYYLQHKQKGVYHKFRTFEISPLPDGKESNPFTVFELDGEKAMKTLTEAQKSELVKILGQEEAANVLAATEKASKALEEHGIAFKGDTESEPETDFKAYQQQIDQRFVAMEKQISDVAEAMNKAAVAMETLLTAAHEKKETAPRAAQADIPADERKQALVDEMKANREAKSIEDRQPPKSPAEFLFGMGG